MMIHMHSCIIEAEHVMNEIWSTCNVVVEVSRGQSNELVILSPESSINSHGLFQIVCSNLHKHYANLQVDFKYGELVGCFKSECELPDYKESSECMFP